MRNERNLLIIIFLVGISFCGCKKVIDLNLRDAESQIIITGEINNHRGPYTIKISRSVTFSSDNIFPPVRNAFVTITGNGTTDTLSEVNPGEYLTRKIEGKPGKNYSLLVAIEGKIFTAKSTMPMPVKFDSLSFLQGRNNNIFFIKKIGRIGIFAKKNW